MATRLAFFVKICDIMHMEIRLFEQYIRQGKEALYKSEPQKAMNFLGSALEIIPSDNQLELIETLFLLGVSLKRLGQVDSAQQCWRSGMALFSELNNDSSSPTEIRLEEEDDIFKQLHLKRYLNNHKHLDFHNNAERDYVIDLIEEAWISLVESGLLEGIEFEDRIMLYFDTKIAFPGQLMRNI